MSVETLKQRIQSLSLFEKKITSILNVIIIINIATPAQIRYIGRSGFIGHECIYKLPITIWITGNVRKATSSTESKRIIEHNFNISNADSLESWKRKHFRIYLINNQKFYRILE